MAARKKSTGGDDDKPVSKSETDRGRFAFEELSRTIHERARLGIMASLAAHVEGLSFPDLRRYCDLTDGNLNRHLQVLHEAGLVAIKKEGQGRGSQTWCSLTATGRKELAAYVAALERVVAEAAGAIEATERSARKSPRPGWAT